MGLQASHVTCLELKDANFPAEEFIHEHESDESHIQPPVKIYLGGNRTEDTSGNPRRITIFVEDPHHGLDLESNYTIQDSWEPLYSSHIKKSSEICQVHQEGSELIFDCDIMNPASADSSDWKEVQEYWSRYEADREHLTRIDIEEPSSPVKTDSSSETQQTGLLPRLVSGGLTFISGII